MVAIKRALLGIGIVTAGVLASTALVVSDPLAPAASADELVPFDNCQALRDWYVDHAVDEVGPYGWGGGGGWLNLKGGDVAFSTDAAGSVPLSAPAAAERSAADGQASSATGTNTQEADVDEPDVAKTDGRLVYRMVDGRTLVIDDASGTAPRKIGQAALPEDATGGELLLAGDRVLVIGGSNYGVMPMEDTPGGIGAPVPDMAYRMMPVSQGTRVISIDVSDPTKPRLVDDEQYGGQLISARLYGSTVRLVTSAGRPELRFTYPDNGISETEALRRNRELVRATTVEDWLPTVGTDKKPLVACDQVLHPRTWSGSGTITVTAFPVTDPDARRSIGITADGQTVYSSTERLYVASTRWGEPVAWREFDSGGPDVATGPVEPPGTDVHAFTLDGAATTYAGSGRIEGTIRDRWSMDEHDGVLRVAWTRDGHNGITTLREREGALKQVGELGRLGVDEQIQSVRWFDDLVVMVTFRQVDPLYTIDLSDPARPRELGELKIPGYSGYLHPVGDQRLLGLGVSATNEGRRLGTQAAVFDIKDLTDPRQTARIGLGTDTDLPVMGDPRAFTWLPAMNTAFTTVTDWQTGRSELVALKVGEAGTLFKRTLASLANGWQTRVLPLADGRIAVVDSGLQVVDPT